MATYIILANFTEKGAANIKDSAKVIRDRMEGAKTAGVTVKGLYYTQGVYDTVGIVEGDEMAVMGGLINMAADGLVRTTTLRAFSLDEMDQVFSRLP